jgi:hypothetical protein
MKLKRYNQFVDYLITENLDKAKKFLKERELIKRAAKQLGLIDAEMEWKIKDGLKKTILLSDFNPEQQLEIKNKLKELKLSDQEIKEIEKDINFVKIREFLNRNQGWIYPFTYFHFVEMFSLESLFTDENSLFKRLIEYKDLLGRMPKKFDQNFIDINIPNNREKLDDMLDHLKNYRSFKKMYDKLTSTLKKDYNNSPDSVKEEFENVAVVFDQLGNGDDTEKEKLWKSFFGEIRVIENDQVIRGKLFKKGDKKYYGPLEKYKKIKDFIQSANNYIKLLNFDFASKFYDSINECNDKFGTNGVDILFSENGIVIFVVNSYYANHFLHNRINGASIITYHCIAESQNHWNTYVKEYGKQYYIYNLNLEISNSLFVIGVTIEPDGSVSNAHAKKDENIKGKLKTILNDFEKDWGVEDIFSYLKPISKEEMEKREKTKKSEREIVKPGITIEQLKKYVLEDGADINKLDGRALINAVEEDDYEKVKVCLELGALADLKSGSETAISKVKSLEILKELVLNGAKMENSILTNIIDNPEILEFCIKNGMDPNFSLSMPIRLCCIGTWKSQSDTGKSFFESFKTLIENGAKVDKGDRWAAEFGRVDILEYLNEQEHFEKYGDKDNFINKITFWLKHSSRLNEKDKEKINDILNKIFAKK